MCVVRCIHVCGPLYTCVWSAVYMCVVLCVLYYLCDLWFHTVVFGHHSMYCNKYVLYVHYVLCDGLL